MSFKSNAIGLALGPTIYESIPPLKDEGKFFIHEVIYKTNTGSFKMVLLNDNRPVKIIVAKEFK